MTKAPMTNGKHGREWTEEGTRGLCETLRNDDEGDDEDDHDCCSSGFVRFRPLVEQGLAVAKVVREGSKFFYDAY